MRQEKAKTKITADDVSNFQTEREVIRVPTCLENPNFYFLISHLAIDAEVARQELGLPLWELPKFGSLPSNDINAYTYPTRKWSRPSNSY